MALGASPRDVMRWVFAHGLRPVFIGAFAGLSRRRDRRYVPAQPAVRCRTNRPSLTGRCRAHSSVRVLAGVLSPCAPRGGVRILRN